MLRALAQLVLGLCIVVIMAPTATAQTVFDLQQALDQAKEGEIIVIPAGTYEGEFSITKNITMRGEGEVVLQAPALKPALTIEAAQQVRVENITLAASQKALVVKDSADITLSDLRMANMHTGVQIHRTKNITIKGLQITGSDAHYAKKGNGIAIYQSAYITIDDTIIDSMQDGLYIEEVQHITARNNRITNGRYGTHFMYTDDAVVENNYFDGNVTGLMVMMVNRLTATGNESIKQNDINSNGIFLYEVKDIIITNNRIAENRIGMVMQKVENVAITNNRFEVNQTAIEATRVDDLTIAENNQFTGNILTARSDNTGMQLANNYYDDYTGIDANGDGKGDTPYVAFSSFGQWMVRQPAYQYFVASPSVSLLTTLDGQINQVEKSVLVDATPTMTAPSHKSDNVGINGMQIAGGAVALFAGLILWRRGMSI